MSTKATIACGTGPNGVEFHLYHECFDDENVYLEIDKAEFEANRDTIMVRIPMEVWESVRQYRGIDLSKGARTDAELLAHVEQNVDNRIAEVTAAVAAGKTTAWINLCGGAIYGPATDPRGAQIENGMAYHTKQRDLIAGMKAIVDENISKFKPGPYIVKLDEPAE